VTAPTTMPFPQTGYSGHSGLGRSLVSVTPRALVLGRRSLRRRIAFPPARHAAANVLIAVVLPFVQDPASSYPQLLLPNGHQERQGFIPLNARKPMPVKAVQSSRIQRSPLSSTRENRGGRGVLILTTINPSILLSHPF
jgi:hypothetical protein